MSSAVVVGAGVTGMLSALILRTKFKEVYLIEREDDVGGLFRSIEAPTGHQFDYGFHVPGDTGITALDQLLYGNFEDSSWHKYTYLKSGSYFAGSLCEMGSAVDVREQPYYEKGMKEFMQARPAKENYKNYEDFVRHEFGDTFTEELYAKIARKWFNCSLSELSPECRNVFRFKLFCLDAAQTTEIKASDNPLSNRIEFHDASQKASPFLFYYPKKGGIQLWVNLLQSKLKESGVQVLTGTNVASLNRVGGDISSLTTSSGEEIKLDLLVWSVPLFQCLRLAGLELPFTSEPPQRLTTYFHNFVFNKPLETKLHYITCYDPDVHFQQITMYSNLQPGANQSNPHLTVTINLSKEQDLDKSREKTLGELKNMGVISSSTDVSFEASSVYGQGWPVPTHQFVKTCEQQLEFAKSNLTNVKFIGKAVGPVFLSRALLIDAYQQLSSL